MFEKRLDHFEKEFTDETNVVVTITGTKINIKTAQYLMQKLLKQRA